MYRLLTDSFDDGGLAAVELEHHEHQVFFAFRVR
jgi:hypothetical protein